ncbi:uncharacterized protein LOC123542324 [Mercenaria mercenaria]|uniref:uncharacterized protein LOC123542324 n=1 Tax=Mercenaria mercenaria TaxID=6596 RepID=UPI00234EB202|nr:uncharacterized protein LOC123542324 [Mercenaria mercenaria]
MLLKQEGLLHKGPEFCQAVKFVIKLQISTLLQQLAESGEESVVLTANVLEGTADHLGSNRGAGFLEDHEQLQKQFLSYCAETRRLSVDEEADNLPPRSSLSDNNLLSPTLVSSVSPYHRSEPVRSRYDRESSTSDSVFSPDRRKSSASSKSLDEDVAMLTSQEYSDTPRSLSDSSTNWPPDTSGVSLDTGDRGAGLRYGINRSPTCRTAELSDRLKHTSKSPMSDSVENIKHITLSSPSEFQYRKYHHQHSGNYPTVSAGAYDPQRLPPMFEFSKPAQFPASAGSEENSLSYSSKSNSGIATTMSSTTEEEMSEISPGNAGQSGTGVKLAYSSESSPNTANTTEAVFSPYVMYKVPFSNYSDRGIRQRTSSENYKQGYEEEGGENKYKSQYPTQDGAQGSQSETETYCGAESREYQSELGEIYRLPKKLESKMYKQSSSVRKHPKSGTERRSSETLSVHSFESSSSQSVIHVKDEDTSTGDTVKSPDVISQSEISKSFEEAVKIQQSIFHSSLGLFSPLQRQFLQPTRPCPQRERSQSLSDFHTLTSPEMVTHVGRARFPSSSYAENLDTPLVIDDDSKTEGDTREGLDLSNKKRKMSVDDIYTSAADDQMEAAGVNVPANQNEEQEYERLMQAQSGGATGRDDSSSGSTKKYGKGNFIKVATGYQCRICCRVIRHMNNTTAHMRIHANVKPYKCQVCNQQFKYEVDRRYHFSKNHVDLFSKMYFPEEKKSG